MSEAEITIEPSIREWTGLLRETPERVDLEVRKRWRDSAAKVRDKARAEAQSQKPSGSAARRKRGGQHWRHLVNSIKSGASSDGPFVSVGSPQVPWALGFEFGSARYSQFPPWAGNATTGGGGHFFWPTFRRERPEIEAETYEALAEALNRVFPQ